MLTAINIYQILVSIMSLIIFVQSFVKAFIENNNQVTGFLSLLLIVLTLSTIYTNIMILLKKKEREFIIVNIWLNFIQVFYLSLVGFTYYILIGIEIIPYFIYKENIKFGIYYELFSARGGLAIQSGNEISVGLSILPALICIMLTHILKKKSNSDDLMI